jgi:hypothetical protein
MRESYILFRLQAGEETRGKRAAGLGRSKEWREVLRRPGGDHLSTLMFFAILSLLFAGSAEFASGQTQPARS